MNYLKVLREYPEFQFAIDELKAKRPVIPKYSPASSFDDEQMLLNRIKYETARQDGFDLIFLCLTGERHD